jgi:cobalt-zinc-cadmium efflux system membrane fusion protein
MKKELTRRHLPKLALVIAGAVVAVALIYRGSPQHTAEATRAPHAATDGGATLALGPAALAHNPIATAKVTRARLAGDLPLVGSVSYDQSHYAVVGPLVPGRVVKLHAALGDQVRAGQLLAEIESAEVGQAQAAWLSATARANAADANLRRERELAAQHVSSAREEEVAQALAVSESAEVRAATERLRAFGLAAADLSKLAHAGSGGRVPLRTPIDGTVVTRTLALGQAVERGTDAFQIVDLTHLWVLLDVHEKDLGRVHVGQKAELSTEGGADAPLQAEVSYVSPIVDDKTRTAHVRIALDNRKGALRPGQYVTARLIGDPAHDGAPVLAVPRKCLQRVDGKLVAFVRSLEGFQRRAVEAGRAAGELIEVRAGLAEGDEVAADGAFLLKSELLR